MNIEGLSSFLKEFAQNGYGAENEGTLNPNGSKTILYQDDNTQWEANDTYWGGEPFSGDTVISYQGRPTWTVLYLGSVSRSERDLEPIYAFLRGALLQSDPDFPVRGPKEYSQGELKYVNHWHGNLQSFEGKERILRNGNEIYKTQYMGGQINERDE